MAVPKMRIPPDARYSTRSVVASPGRAEVGCGPVSEEPICRRSADRLRSTCPCRESDRELRGPLHGDSGLRRGLSPLRHSFQSVLVVMLFASAAVAQDAGPADAGLDGAAESDAHVTYGPVQHEHTKSRSIGRTNRGWQRNSVAVESSTTVQVRNRGSAHGTREMVDLLTWAAGEVARQHPGSVMTVGDISRRSGGRMRPHRSHRAGRDADIGFYLLDARLATPVAPRRFVTLADNGKGNDRTTGYLFDVVRNYAFIEALLTQEVVQIQYIMVVTPLRDMLLAEAERRGAAGTLLERIRAVVGPRTTGRGRWARRGTHDSHFHIRIYCAQDDRPRCVDQAPFWDWISRPAVRRPRVRRRRRGRAAMRGSSGRRRGGAARMRSRRPRMRGSSMRR